MQLTSSQQSLIFSQLLSLVEAILYFNSGKPLRFVNISDMHKSQRYESQGPNQGLGAVIGVTHKIFFLKTHSKKSRIQVYWNPPPTFQMHFIYCSEWTSISKITIKHYYTKCCSNIQDITTESSNPNKLFASIQSNKNTKPWEKPAIISMHYALKLVTFESVVGTERKSRNSI